MGVNGLNKIDIMDRAQFIVCLRLTFEIIFTKWNGL